MQDYQIVEQSRNENQKYISAAINFLKPTYIRIITSVPLKVDDKIQIDQNKVMKDNNAIGEVILYKSDDEVALNTEYDIKYTGGYSNDGKVIYLDKDFPKELIFNGKIVYPIISIGLHHELPEKWLIDDAYEYPYAHKIATMVEREYVEYLGINWDDYSKEVNKNLALISSKKLQKSPPNLDLSPYTYDHNTNALEEIRKTQALLNQG